nr:MAG: capsid protein [Cressdnaviricota sp.]
MPNHHHSGRLGFVRNGLDSYVAGIHDRVNKRHRTGNPKVIWKGPPAPPHTRKSYKKRKLRVSEESEREHGITEKSVTLHRTKATMSQRKVAKGKWRYEQTHAGILSNPAGAQSISNLLYVGTAAQSMTSSGDTYNNGQNYDALYQLNPYDFTSGSALFAAGISPSTAKFMLLEHSIMIEFANTCTSAMIFDIYVVQCKKATTLTAESAWANGYADAALGTSVQTFPVPGSTTALVGSLSQTMVGAVPSQSQQFRNYWKIRKVKHVDLPAGGSYVYKIKIVQDAVQNQEYLNNQIAQSVPYVANQTFEVFVVQRGQVVVDTTSGHLATFGGTQLAYVATVKTIACCVKGNSERVNIYQAVTALPANATAAHQATINVVDGLTTLVNT